MKKQRRAAIIFIFVTIVLDVLSLGVTIPVAPKLIEGMVFKQRYVGPQQERDALSVNMAADMIAIVRESREEEESKNKLATEDHFREKAREALREKSSFSDAEIDSMLRIPLSGVTARASFFFGFFGATWALMQFIFSPIMGALSDRFGRRRVILISCFGLGLDYILMALAPNLVWFFIGRILSGITAASFSTAAAYVADVTPPERRAASYGLFGAAFGIGFVVGPGAGGLLGEFGLRIPFWVAAALTLCNAAYGYFILPESLSLENRSKFSWRKANPLGSLKLLRSHPELLGLASILLIYQLAHQVFPSVFVLYAGHRYNWDSKTVGITLMVVGIASVIMQGFIVRRTAAALGERRMLFIALSFGAGGYFIYGVANTGWIFWGAIPVFSLVGFFSPAIQGLMTRRVSAKEQGQLQGANSSLMGIAGMVGPLVFTWVFAAAIDETAPVKIPGAPFLLATALHLIGVCVAIYVVKPTEAQPELSGSKPHGAGEGGKQQDDDHAAIPGSSPHQDHGGVD